MWLVIVCGLIVSQFITRYLTQVDLPLGRNILQLSASRAFFNVSAFAFPQYFSGLEIERR
jgi:hypothetical protein